jgi:hypothetical protein
VGIYDSSRTRVAPVFGRLQCFDPTGRYWLQSLVELANTRKVPDVSVGDSRLTVAKWWPREARLSAPPSLLRWLLANAGEPRKASAWGHRPEVRERRRRIVDRDAATVAEALEILEKQRASGRAWYVLEGPTQPDAYLATDDVIVVIEGKRTEAGPETSTEWMNTRHQMIRHLDAAWEIRQNRRVYGLFIVEATEEEATAPPRSWLDAVDLTVSGDALKGSLPHRTPEEQKMIGDALLGVATWQAVCVEFNLPLEVLIPQVLAAPPRPGRRSGATPQPNSELR